MFMGQPAIPQYIKFIAKDEEQTILESPRGVREIYYRIWVKKLVNNDCVGFGTNYFKIFPALINEPHLF